MFLNVLNLKKKFIIKTTSVSEGTYIFLGTNYMLKNFEMDYCYLGDTMQLRPYMMRDYEALPLGSLEKICSNNSNKQKTYYCQGKIY